MAQVLAAVDIGTVSTRLALAEVDASGAVRMLDRRATITNLGSGVDATGRLDAAAIERTCATVRDYAATLSAWEARGVAPLAVTCTTTSAARDAANASELTDALRAMGLRPQVIDGQVEAHLALLGVTADFCGQRVLVADSGGGSTELAEGLRTREGLRAGRVVSLDIGCRRVTERFLAPAAGEDPDAFVPATEQVEAARAFAAELFGRELAGRDARDPATLVCVGGTATSLVAVARELVPYDSAFVHLHRMERSCVSELAARLLGMPVSRRRELPGLQPKRADVIAAGALILDELMAAGGFDAYTCSESDSLVGLLACARAAVADELSPLGPGGWLPELGAFAREGTREVRG